MNTSKLTSSEYFKGINIVYYALISGVLIFLLIALFLKYTNNFAIDDIFSINTIKIVFLFFLIAGIVGSHFIFSNKLKTINQRNNDLLIKTAEYRSVLIIRYALLEGAAFFSIIGYLLTGSNMFIAFTGISIIILTALKPSRERLINDLQLDIAEKEKIYDSNAIISEILSQE